MGKRRIKEWLMTTGVILAALLVLIFMFTKFRNRMNAELNTTTAKYLSGNVDALATAFQTKLDDQLIMLESQTRYFRDVDLTDYNAMKETIMSTRGMEAFTSIGVASGAGSTMNYQGKSSGNILLRDYFQRAMKGESAISARPTTDEFGNEVLVLAVPIHQEDQVVGVVYGTFTRDALSELMRNVRFGEQSANILITEDGTILARSVDSELIDPRSVNIQEIIPGLDIAAIAEQQFITYESDGQDNILILRPIGFHNWYFGMIIPKGIVTEQSDSILRYVLLAMLEVTFVVVCLLLYIFFMYRRNTQEKQMLTEKAQTDLLTGVLNKMAFQEEAEQTLAGAGDSEICALYIIDLDDFKHVNDNLGHAMGDQVLTDAAGKLRGIFHSTDLIGRIGGDEFAAFLHCPREKDIDLHRLMQQRAEAIIRELCQEYEANGKKVQVSASVGMAIYPDHGSDYKSLYEHADKALYTAKRGGKNRYEEYA